MKTNTRILRTVLLSLALGAASLSAQSCAATKNFSAAGSHALNASGEIVQAGAASVVGTAQVAGSVAAVPVWMSGAAVSTGGAVSSAIGDGAAHVGSSLRKGAERVWDVTSGDPAQRPALERKQAVVPPAPAPASARKEPSPAEAMKRL